MLSAVGTSPDSPGTGPGTEGGTNEMINLGVNNQTRKAPDALQRYKLHLLVLYSQSVSFIIIGYNQYQNIEYISQN